MDQMYLADAVASETVFARFALDVKRDEDGLCHTMTRLSFSHSLRIQKCAAQRNPPVY